jgi:hypothetical protein
VAAKQIRTRWERLLRQLLQWVFGIEQMTDRRVHCHLDMAAEAQHFAGMQHGCVQHEETALVGHGVALTVVDRRIRHVEGDGSSPASIEVLWHSLDLTYLVWQMGAEGLWGDRGGTHLRVTSVEFTNALTMDRITYCSALDERLHNLEKQLSNRAFPAPATVPTAKRQTDLRQRRDALLERIQQTRVRVSASLQTDESNWDTTERDFDREEQDIMSLARSL